jgi:hypothetical protein
VWDACEILLHASKTKCTFVNVVKKDAGEHGGAGHGQGTSLPIETHEVEMERVSSQYVQLTRAVGHDTLNSTLYHRVQQAQ